MEIKYPKGLILLLFMLSFCTSLVQCRYSKPKTPQRLKPGSEQLKDFLPIRVQGLEKLPFDVILEPRTTADAVQLYNQVRRNKKHLISFMPDSVKNYGTVVGKVEHHNKQGYRSPGTRHQILTDNISWRTPGDSELIFGVRAFYKNGTSKLIGEFRFQSIGLKKIKPGFSTDVAYWMDDQFTGMGIMSAINKTMFAFGFNVFKFDHINLIYEDPYKRYCTADEFFKIIGRAKKITPEIREKLKKIHAKAKVEDVNIPSGFIARKMGMKEFRKDPDGWIYNDQDPEHQNHWNNSRIFTITSSEFKRRFPSLIK